MRLASGTRAETSGSRGARVCGYTRAGFVIANQNPFQLNIEMFGWVAGSLELGWETDPVATVRIGRG